MNIFQSEFGWAKDPDYDYDPRNHFGRYLSEHWLQTELEKAWVQFAEGKEAKECQTKT